MARGSLKNSIPDLQLDWATNHSNKSVRDYLMNVKDLSDRQYRYVISHAKLVEWQARRQEIQNSVDMEKIRTYSSKAAKVHAQFVDAAQLGLSKIMDTLVHSDELSPKDLVYLAKALEENQKTFHQAMGLSADDGLVHVYLEMDKRIKESQLNCEPEVVPAREKSVLQQLAYEDLLEFIEWRRDLKKRANAQNLDPQPAQDR